jgi:hypothetical protein
MSGLIAEMAVWNIALADAEVANLAAGLCPLRLQRANLVDYWLHGGLVNQASPEPSLTDSGHDMVVTGATIDTTVPPIFGLPNVFNRRLRRAG